VLLDLQINHRTEKYRIKKSGSTAYRFLNIFLTQTNVTALFPTFADFIGDLQYPYTGKYCCENVEQETIKKYIRNTVLL